MLELVSSGSKKGYRAFEPVRGDSRPMLDLRQDADNGHLLPYAFLRGMSYQGSDPTEYTITLFHISGTATISGRNLAELKEKLAAHAVSWLQVFDSKTDAPPEEGAAIITRLAFVPNDPGEEDDD